jgi:hypothetical protein
LNIEYSKEKDLENLEEIFLNDLKYGKNEKKYIRVQNILKTFKMNAISLIIEDSNGNVKKLSLYNFPNDILNKGSKFIIKEPFLKISSDGFDLIRQDNMNDIVIDKFYFENLNFPTKVYKFISKIE